jgi:hypothetical protein
MVLVPDRAGEHAHAAAVALRRVGRVGFGCFMSNHFIPDNSPHRFFSKRQEFSRKDAKLAKKVRIVCFQKPKT